MKDEKGGGRRMLFKIGEDNFRKNISFHLSNIGSCSDKFYTITLRQPAGKIPAAGMSMYNIYLVVFYETAQIRISIPEIHRIGSQTQTFRLMFGRAARQTRHSHLMAFPLLTSGKSDAVVGYAAVPPFVKYVKYVHLNAFILSKTISTVIKFIHLKWPLGHFLFP